MRLRMRAVVCAKIGPHPARRIAFVEQAYCLLISGQRNVPRPRLVAAAQLAALRGPQDAVRFQCTADTPGLSAGPTRSRMALRVISWPGGNSVAFGVKQTFVGDRDQR
jgi:hypothetical protein